MSPKKRVVTLSQNSYAVSFRDNIHTLVFGTLSVQLRKESGNAHPVSHPCGRKRKAVKSKLSLKKTRITQIHFLMVKHPGTRTSHSKKSSRQLNLCILAVRSWCVQFH